MSCHRLIETSKKRWCILTDDEMNVVAGKGDILFCETQGIRDSADDEEKKDLNFGEPSLR